MTLDADIALPPKLPVRGRNIRELLAANGFVEDFLGDDRPPATHYRLKDEASGFYAEFLSPLVGGEYARDGNRKATAQVAGITSQQLRHLELLLEFPWSVDLHPGNFQVEGRKTVQIANPVSFLAQKLLIHKKRDLASKGKDILYIHDTLQVFGPRLEELRGEWAGRISPRLHPSTVRTVVKVSQGLFTEVTDAIRNAAAVSVDRRISPEAVRESCHYGLEQIFR